MPLLVNMRTGETLTFALDRAEDHSAWEQVKRERATEITGVAIKAGPVIYSVPIPNKRQRFDRVRVDAELVFHRDGSGAVVGDRISVFADEVLASVLAYRGDRSKVVRFSLERPGRPRFIPSLDLPFQPSDRD